eukprot:TRINITY_DN48455_c0_g1_i1.p1 TRINITY_DN48455_c0_g1~~TRINITY_DN48455_c0_g1_i1.p1  ORF type:complete len:161 (-),score=48.30 TRINITY_DN48455_c0_g1_i1:25-507(-)
MDDEVLQLNGGTKMPETSLNKLNSLGSRIKKIMRNDDEVGKIAQETPVLMGKAVELFILQLVDKSAVIAREQGAKGITEEHLKQCVDTHECFDFLRAMVAAKVQEAAAKPVKVREPKEPAAKKAKKSKQDVEVAHPTSTTDTQAKVEAPVDATATLRQTL